MAQSWAKKYTSPNSEVVAEAMLSYDNFLYVSSHAFDTTDRSFTGTIISKMTSDGELIWSRKYSFSNTQLRTCDGLIKTKDGKLVILLNYGPYTAIMKIDTAGGVIWGKSITVPYGQGYKIVELNNRNLVLIGTSDHANHMNNGFAIYFDEWGNLLKYYDFVSTYQWNAQLHLYDASKTSDGGYVAIGWIIKQQMVCNTFIVKMDSTGTVQWSKSIGNNVGEQAGTSIEECSGGFVFTGRNNNDLLIGKIDKNGKSLWNKTYLGIRMGWARVKAFQNYFEVAAQTVTDSITHGPLKLILVKIDTTGNYLDGNILQDLYYNNWLEFPVVSYDSLQNTFVLKQDFNYGFKISKIDSSFKLPACFESKYPSEIKVNSFLSVYEAAAYSSTISIETFSASSLSCNLNSEKTCNCKTISTSYLINGCRKDTVVLSTTSGETHLWNTGQSASMVYATQPGTYWAENTGSCNITDTFHVTFSNPLASFIVNYSTDNQIDFVNTSIKASNYVWYFGDGVTDSGINPKHSWSAPGNYTVTLVADSNGCTDTVRNTVNIKGILIPNIFTPNNDGTNDLFNLKAEGVSELNATIFDRWGNKLFSFTDPAQGWNGEGSPSGTYFYIITGFFSNNEPFNLKGFVTLLR